MIKTIKISKEQSVTLNSAAGWFFAYREQFGHDILPDLMPMIEGVLNVAVNVLQNAEDKSNIVDAIDDGVLTDFFYSVSSLEYVTVMQIVWAMAKNADDDIEPPEVWFNQFDVFPFDAVLPKAFKMIIDASVSSKNARRLLNLLKTKAGSISNSSSSQASREG